MSQPDKTKKVVSQIGYDDADVEPFTNNYQSLYRDLLEENRLLKNEIEKYKEGIKDLYNILPAEDDTYE
tara:strand:+ start:502 stop:708 length:207 start_codon:yes stop_codon:yes gene_type:complete